MLCLKQLSMVLLVGILATFAEPEETLQDTPLVTNEQDLRFFFKPVVQVEASQPKPRPTTIVVKPYPFYPYYPQYPFYPQYPPYPYPTAQPTRPPIEPPTPPTVPPTPPTVPPTPPTVPPTPQTVPPTPPTVQPLFIVIRTPDFNGNGNNGNGNNDNNGNNGNNGINGRSIYVTDPLFEAPENQPEAPDYKNAVDAVNVNSYFPIDTKDIKLPFGIQLVSQTDDGASDYNKKVRDQETLIYWKNYKKGSKLAVAPAV